MEAPRAAEPGVSGALAMNSGSQRIALAAAVLAGVWVVTYWLWPAGDKNVGFSFDAPPPVPAAAEGEPAAVDASIRPSAPVAAPPPIVRGAQPSTPVGAPPMETPPAAQGRPGVVPPEFTEYQARAGDTVTSIAERVYGRRELWQAIAKANPSVDPIRLRAGQRLRIPVDPGNTQGASAATAPAPAPRNTEYIVGAGDTLSQIAQAVYGKSTLWPIILDANRDKLKSARDLRAGMRLVIPPSPEPAPPRAGAGV